MSYTRIPALLLALLTLTVVAGCDEKGATEAPTPKQEVKEEPPAPTEVVIYSGRSESLVAPLIEKFEKASGLKAKVKYGNSGELAGTILEEGDKSPADVFWAQDAGTLGLLSEKDLLAELPADVLKKATENYRTPGTQWVATSGRARVLAYNTKKLKEADLPKSVAELTDPKWKGRVGWAPENASFQAFVAAMVEMEGPEATKKWLEGMVANGPKAYPKNTPAVMATSTGEVDVALVNHYYLLRLKAEHGADYPVANYFFKNGKAEALVNVSGVSTLKSSKNREGAHKFVEFLLSPEAQSYFASETHEYPVVEGVKPSGDLPALGTLAPPKVDFAKLANLETTVKLLRETKALP